MINNQAHSVLSNAHHILLYALSLLWIKDTGSINFKWLNSVFFKGLFKWRRWSMKYQTFQQLSLIMLLRLTKTIQTSDRLVAKSTFLMSWMKDFYRATVSQIKCEHCAKLVHLYVVKIQFMFTLHNVYLLVSSVVCNPKL